jgi:hypothetical protein
MIQFPCLKVISATSGRWMNKLVHVSVLAAKASKIVVMILMSMIIKWEKCLE